MPRPVRNVLILLPLALVVTALFVWVRNAVRTPGEPPPVEVQVRSETADGIIFEVEHEMKDGVNLFRSKGPGEATFSRRGDSLDYQRGLLFLRVTRDVNAEESEVEEIALQDVKSGDVVRWNLHGPVLVNGNPAAKHEIQVRAIDATPIEFEWNSEPSQYPRDTLSLAWVGAGRKLAVAHGDGVVRVWDADKRTVLKSITPKSGARGNYGLRVAANPSGNKLAALNMFGEEVVVWSWEKGDKPAEITGESKAAVRQAAFANDQSLLEARGSKLRLRPLDGSPAKDIGTVHEQFEAPFAVHAGTGFVAWSDGTKLHVGPIAGPTFELEGYSAGCLAFSANGSVLAAFNGNDRLALIDPKTGKETKRLRWRGRLGTADSIHALAFSPDGKTLAVGSGSENGGSIRFYDMPSGRERGGMGSPWVRDLAYSADGRTLAAALRYKPGVRLWNTADLVPKKEP
jgi:WD40 repeat protein